MNKYKWQQEYEQFYIAAKPAIAEFNGHRDEFKRLLWAQKCLKWAIGIFMSFALSMAVIKILPIPEEITDVFEIYVVIGVMLTVCALLAVIYRLAPNQSDFTDIDPEADLKKALMAKFLQIFGDFKWQKKRQDLVYDFAALRQTMIIPQNIAVTGDDCISGQYENVGIKMTEINIGQGAFFGWLALIVVVVSIIAAFATFTIFIGGALGAIFQSAVLMFGIWLLAIVLLLVCAVFGIYVLIKYHLTASKLRGVLIEFDMPKHFFGHTFMYENAITAQALRCRSKKGFMQVRLEDSDFNHRYVVFSDNQVEARYVLTPTFMENIKNIALSFMARFYRLSFQNNKMLLLVATNKDLFKMGDVRKNTDKATFDLIYDEITSVLKLIDLFNLKDKKQ